MPDGATGFHRNNSLALPELPARNLCVQLHDEEEDVKERNGDVSTPGAERGRGPIVWPWRRDSLSQKFRSTINSGLRGKMVGDRGGAERRSCR